MKIWAGVFAAGLVLFWPAFIFHGHDHPLMREPARFLVYVNWPVMLIWWTILTVSIIVWAKGKADRNGTP